MTNSTMCAPKLDTQKIEKELQKKFYDLMNPIHMNVNVEREKGAKAFITKYKSECTGDLKKLIDWLEGNGWKSQMHNMLKMALLEDKIKPSLPVSSVLYEEIMQEIRHISSSGYSTAIELEAKLKNVLGKKYDI